METLVANKVVGDQLFKLEYISPCKDIYKFDGKLRN